MPCLPGNREDQREYLEMVYKGLEFLSVSKQQGQVRSAVSWDVIIQYYAERLTVGVRVIFDKIS